MGRAEYVVAGCTIGLAFAAKYQTAALLVPLLVAHLQRDRARRDKYLLLAIGASLVCTVIAFPPLVTETRRVLGDIWVGTVLPSRLGYEGLDPTRGAGYVYYAKVLAWGIGLPMLVLAMLATGRAVVQRDWPLLIVATMPIVLYVTLGGSHLYFARFLLPAVPALVVLAAVMIDDLVAARPLLACAVALITIVWTAADTVRFDHLLTRPDTRLTARAWVQANVAPDELVLTDGGVDAPPLQGVAQGIQPVGRALFDGTLDEYRRQGISYVIASSFTADAPNLDPARDARRRAFYATLEQEATRVVEFRAYRGERPLFVYDRLYGPFDSLSEFEYPGPTLTVYRIR